MNDARLEDVRRQFPQKATRRQLCQPPSSCPRRVRVLPFLCRPCSSLSALCLLSQAWSTLLLLFAHRRRPTRRLWRRWRELDMSKSRLLRRPPLGLIPLRRRCILKVCPRNEAGCRLSLSAVSLRPWRPLRADISIRPPSTETFLGRRRETKWTWMTWSLVSPRHLKLESLSLDRCAYMR